MLMAGLVLVAGCASSADDIAPSYVSPIAYENYSCEQLAFEAQSVSSRAAQAAGVQNKARTSDAVVTTVGVVVFWPALFFLDGDGQQAAELARLKGQMEAIEQSSIRKNCGIEFQREAPPAKKSQQKTTRGDLAKP
jgi:hypothetical protein